MVRSVPPALYLRAIMHRRSRSGRARGRGAGWLLDSTVDFGEMPGGFPWGANPGG